MLDITVDIHKKDLIKLNIYYYRTAKSTWIIFSAIFFIIFLLILSNQSFRLSGVDLLVAFICATLGATFGLLFGILWSLITIAIFANQRSGVLGIHEYRIEQDGFKEKTAVNETLIKWAGIQEVIILRHYILVRINNYLFHVLPKRAFATPTEFIAFGQTLKNKLASKK